MPQPEPRDPDIGLHADPAVWRGLTARRVSRRGLLRAGGLAAGAATLAGGTGLASLLAGCGDAAPVAAVTEAVGTTDWWSKQRLRTWRS